MNKLNILLTICFPVVLEFALINSQSFCPPNEVPADCTDICNRCHSAACPLICLPGCQCIPGFTRDSNMNCIPISECPGFLYESQEDKSEEDTVQQILNWEDNKRGCPDETLCKKNCRRRGIPYLDGVCTGPNMKHCHCLNCSISTSKDDSLTRNGCPNVAECNKHCKKSGNIAGVCIGPGKLSCSCIRKRAEDSLLSPTTVRGGCPVATFCNVFCNSRGFKKGLCLGPKREYCNCYELISGQSQASVFDDRKRKPNANSRKKVDIKKNNKKDKVPANTSCPDLGKCISSCQAKGQISGFCSGTGRRECKCIKQK